METNEKKEKMTLKEKIMLGVSLVAAATGIGCLGYSIHKERKLGRMLSNSISRVDELTEVRVSEGIVNKAIEDAVEREVSKVAKRAAEDFGDRIETDVSNRVKGAVEQHLARLQKSVGEQVAREVSKINKDDIMNEVLERAKEEAAKEFASALKNVTDQYQQNLNNVGEIYQQIASKMTGSGKEAGKGFEVKFG